MNLGLLFPAALAALAAALVPLILHIARKSETAPTDFAALRWLRQRPKPRSRLRFDEWPLLLLRLALIALAALWLAQPVLFGAGDDSPYVAVAPGARIDRATLGEARVHWLAPGFPSIENARPARAVPTASLIRQLDADLPQGTPLTIVTPSIIEGADGGRLRLSRKIGWRIVPGLMTAPMADAIVPPALSVRVDGDHRPALRYVRGAALAWPPPGRDADIDVAAADDPLPGHDRTLIWLAGGTISASVLDWVKQGGTMLAASDARLPANRPAMPIWRDGEGATVVEAFPLGRGRLLRFTRPLAPAQMPMLLDADFPVHLRALLTAQTPPSRVAVSAYRAATGGVGYDQPPRPLRPWLALLIVLLLLAERWLATRRSRGFAP